MVYPDAKSLWAFGHLEVVQGGNLAAAEQQFQVAAQLEPQHQWYLLPLADVRIRRHHLKEARETLKPLLRPEAPPDLR